MYFNENYKLHCGEKNIENAHILRNYFFGGLLLGIEDFEKLMNFFEGREQFRVTENLNTKVTSMRNLCTAMDPCPAVKIPDGVMCFTVHDPHRYIVSSGDHAVSTWCYTGH